MINERLMSSYGPESEQSPHVQLQMIQGQYQGEHRKSVRIINVIALSVLIGMGLWGLIIAIFIFILN